MCALEEGFDFEDAPVDLLFEDGQVNLGVLDEGKGLAICQEMLHLTVIN